MKQKTNRPFIIGSLCAISCEILFGLSYLFSKQATQIASAFALLGWRFFIALMIFMVCIRLEIFTINLKGKPLKPLLVIALFNPIIYFIGETMGIHLTSASESGVFLACIPIVSLIASTLILNKRPTQRQIMGISITLGGVLVTVLAVGGKTSLSLIGYLFLMLAVIAYALYSVFVEREVAYTEIEITYVMLIVAALIFTMLAIGKAIVNGTLYELITLPLLNRSFLIAVLYQGIGCSILAFSLSNVATSMIVVNWTSAFIAIATVISIIAGIFVLNEPFNH